jgi:hypothetical protein
VSAGAGRINIRYRTATQAQLMEIFKLAGILEFMRTSVTMDGGLGWGKRNAQEWL